MKQALLLLAVLGAAGLAHAQAPPLAVSYSNCPLLSPDDVARSLGIELRSGAAQLDVQAPPSVAVRCRGESPVVDVSVTRAGRREPVTRTVDLSSVGTAGQTRLLALTIVELAFAAQQPEPEPKPAEPVASVAPVAPIAESGRAVHSRLSLFGAADGFFQGTGLLAGGGVRFSSDVGPWLGWQLGVREEHGSPGFDLGSVAVDAPCGELLAYVHRTWSWGDARLGAGLRAGAAHFVGRPAAAEIGSTALWAAWGGPALGAGARFELSPLVSLELNATAGEALARSGAKVGERAINVAGPWIGLDLGIGFSL